MNVIGSLNPASPAGIVPPISIMLRSIFLLTDSVRLEVADVVVHTFVIWISVFGGDIVTIHGPPVVPGKTARSTALSLIGRAEISAP